MMTGPVAGFRRLLAALDRLGIPYLVGGSAASSVHGIWRATADIDIVAAIGPAHVDLLVEELGSDFYVDADQIRSALEQERSFNLIHFQSGFKFDIFPLAADPYQQAQFGRRHHETCSLFGGEPIEFTVATAEDVILSKLRWYRQGGEVSEQQWNDVLGVVAVQRGRLDLDYLRQWARYLKVSALLEQALAERRESGG